MDPGEALRRPCGFEHFRPGQAEALTAALARTRVGLFVVDEAHRISQWGHDFRTVCHATVPGQLRSSGGKLVKLRAA